MSPEYPTEFYSAVLAAEAELANDPAAKQADLDSRKELMEECARNSEYYMREVKTDPKYANSIVTIVGQQVVGIINRNVRGEALIERSLEIDKEIIERMNAGEFSNNQVAAYVKMST